MTSTLAGSTETPSLSTMWPRNFTEVLSYCVVHIVHNHHELTESLSREASSIILDNLTTKGANHCNSVIHSQGEEKASACTEKQYGHYFPWETTYQSKSGAQASAVLCAEATGQMVLDFKPTVV